MAHKPIRILLVEDEPRVATFVRQGLDEEGYQVEWVTRGKPATDLALSEPFDLVLLDVRLPDVSGLDVCHQIRLHNPVLPILMLTALDAVEDRVAGLRAGADDYLPKPFAFDELLARIEALIRRSHAPAGQSPVKDGPLTIDPHKRSCDCDGQPMTLSAKEFDLLAYFVARRGVVLSRDDIHRDVWGITFDRGTNLIDVYVGYVRKKLQSANCPMSIESVRGIGYRYIGFEDVNDPEDRDSRASEEMS